MKRVVVTGMGAVSPFGVGVEPLFKALRENQGCTRALPELESIKGLSAAVGGLATGVDPKVIPRKHRRSMSNMSIFACLACEETLNSGRVPRKMLEAGDVGLVLGSTVGSGVTMEAFFKHYIETGGIEQVRSTLFFRIMSHGCAASVAQYLGISGLVISPAAACATGLQAVGLAYEAIACGKQTMILCGGTEEFSPLSVGSFDVIQAASTAFNKTPGKTPRPFDLDRDGIVCSEGCGVLLLESLESAKRRGAIIYADILGFASLNDPESLAHPSKESLMRCMKTALNDANTAPEEVGYVNAHATGTRLGDEAEAQAIAALFGSETPVSSLKGHLGHSLAASGSLELIASIFMMNAKTLIPTRNLENPDPTCSGANLLLNIEEKQINRILKNSFALGGINSSLVVGG